MSAFNGWPHAQVLTLAVAACGSPKTGEDGAGGGFLDDSGAVDGAADGGGGADGAGGGDGVGIDGDHCAMLAEARWVEERVGPVEVHNDAPEMVIAGDGRLVVLHAVAGSEGALSIRPAGGGAWVSSARFGDMNFGGIEVAPDGSLLVMVSNFANLATLWAGDPDRLDALGGPEGMSGGSSQSFAVGPDGAAWAVLTADFTDVDRGRWTSAEGWSTTPLGPVANYAFGVALDVDAAGAPYTSAWVTLGADWAVMTVDEAGDESLRFSLGSSTLHDTHMDQAVVTVDGAPQVAIMVGQNEGLLTKGVRALRDDPAGELLVSVDDAGYVIASPVTDGERVEQRYGQVHPLGVTARGSSLVYVWARVEVVNQLRGDCSGAGEPFPICTWLIEEQTVHSVVEGVCSHDGGAWTPFSMADGGQAWRGRPLLTGGGLYLPLIHTLTDGTGAPTGSELRVLLPEGR